MTLADLELAFVIARVAYQTEVAEGEPYLVDPDNVTFEILPPGTYDSKIEKRVEAWTIVMGEEGDRGIVRAEGATLAEAVAEFRRVVRLRAATVPALIAEVRRLRAALDAIGAAAATYDAASNVFRAQVCGGGRIDAVSIEAAHTALLDAIRARGAGGGA